MSGERAPLVGVTTSRRGSTAGFVCSWIALHRAGARTRRLQPPFRDDELEQLSAVVIGGGSHIEPSRYEQKAIEQYRYDVERDELEWHVLHAATEHLMPVLGICRGAQMLNVFCGGTLWQDLTVDMPGVQLRPSVMARKCVVIEPDTRVARAMGVHDVRVNSLHTQGINRLGRGLRVAARDGDGIVQAIEASDRPDHFAIGVQWHPEYLPLVGAHQRLFAALVDAARHTRPARIPAMPVRTS